MEDFVPSLQGAHSTVGRATNRGMDKKRHIMVEIEDNNRRALEARKEAAERIAAERAQGNTGGGGKPMPKAHTPAATHSSKAATGSHEGAQEGGTPKHKKGGGAPHPAPPQDKLSTPMGRAVRDRLNLNPGSPVNIAADAAAQSPTGGLGMSPLAERAPDEMSLLPVKKVEKPSPSFTSLGPADQVYSEAARMFHGRSIIEGCAVEASPDVGHYRVNDKCVSRRVAVSEFGYRVPHPVRSTMDTRDTSRELGPSDLTVLDCIYHKSGSMFVQPSMYSTMSSQQPDMSMSASSASFFKGQSIMSSSVERPSLGNTLGSRNGLTAKITMTETCGNCPPEDRNTSAHTRPPEWDLKKALGRKGGNGASAQCQFFEAGKYAVNHDVVLPNAKKLIGFNQQMSRSSPSFSGAKEKAMLDNEKGTGNLPDRSQYRHCRTHAPRVINVMEMSKDTNRPPMVVHKRALHDENDPEVCRLVHERSMTFDADSVGRAVERRRDYSLNMGASVSRERAGTGTRIVAARGHPAEETTGSFSSSVEALKDSTSARRDLGMTFDQHKARDKTRLKAAHSSLHRPRDHAAPDFSRTPPFSGFDSRTPVKVLARSRSHDAMPGWSVEAVDGLMEM